MQSVFVRITKLIASTNDFCREVFCNNFGRAGIFSWRMLRRTTLQKCGVNVFSVFLCQRCHEIWRESASPKPHPSKPHPCNVPQARTEVALQFSECCAAEVALQHSLFCSADLVFTKSCAATNEKLHCNIQKAALQESGAFLPLSCGFQAPTFRPPRLVRKILVSINFLSAILGPEMAAPILWTSGKKTSVLQEKPCP